MNIADLFILLFISACLLICRTNAGDCGEDGGGGGGCEPQDSIDAEECQSINTLYTPDDSCYTADSKFYDRQGTQYCPEDSDKHKLCYQFQDSTKDFTIPAVCFNSQEKNQTTFRYLLSDLDAAIGSGTAGTCNDEDAIDSFLDANYGTVLNIFACSDVTDCPANTGRRYLSKIKPVLSDEFSHAELVRDCSDALYNLLLHATGHLSILAVPVNGNDNCPPLRLHAKLGVTSKRPSKELEIYSMQDQFREMFPSANNVALGAQVRLGALYQAYQQAQIMAPVGATEYDAVKHNCAFFILSFCGKLDIAINNPELVTFVARQLVENNGAQLAEFIRKSLYLPLVSDSPDTGDKSDEEIVKMLVDATVNGLII